MAEVIFAQLNDSNVVTQVIVVSPANAPDEATGIAFCKSLFGSDTTWIQSGGVTDRKNIAQIGGTYNSSMDAFIQEKPYTTWTLNTSTALWEPPIDYPDDSVQKIGSEDGVHYGWNNDNNEWDKLSP